MASTQKKFRLVTAGDQDGLVSAVLLSHLDMVDEIKFVHPKEVQDGRIEITGNDITSNLPYAEGAHLAFSHRKSETLRRGEPPPNYIINPEAHSASRVIYEYYGGKETFPESWNEMMAAVDKADMARFTIQDVLYPQGWTLLNFLIDQGTGLEKDGNFRISYVDLMKKLVRYYGSWPIDEMFALPDIKERVEVYFEREMKFKEQLKRCTTIHGTVALLDLRHEDRVFAGNRFMIYALNPDCNISIRVSWGLNREYTFFAVGKSIFNRTSMLKVGELMSRYGGGGHENAGTCKVSNDKADGVSQELLRACQDQSS